MNRSFFLFAFLSLLAILPFSAQADFITVSGDVSGVWDVDSVIVTGEVRVPPGEMLTIMPGTSVLFQVYCKFIVDSAATLIAVGTEEDSIRFDELTPGIRWGGLRFQGATSRSWLQYCHLTHGLAAASVWYENCGGAIFCMDCSITIQNCLIDRCKALYYGGAVYSDNSAPTLEENIIACDTASWGGGAIYLFYSGAMVRANDISENVAEIWGGGIVCIAFNPAIRDSIVNNNIKGNSAPYGGAVYCDDGVSPLIQQNTIAENQAVSEGGGIHFSTADPIIIGNLIHHNIVSGSSGRGGGIFGNVAYHAIIRDNVINDNSASYDGGGIYYSNGPGCLIAQNRIQGNVGNSGGGIYGSNFGGLVIRNLIVGNQAQSYWGQGGGVCLAYNSDTILYGNIIASNSANSGNPAAVGGLYGQSSRITIINTIFWGNSAGQLSFSSALNEIAYSDIQDTLWPGEGNISADPLFVNPEQNDYRLLWGSPCIDSGDPDPQYNDPDSTRSDMGAFYYDQSVPVRVLLTPYNAPIQIPPEGGTFDYMITASNCTGSPLTADFWCDATLPSGSLIGPLLGPVAAMIPANDNVSVLRRQRVPGGMPKAINYNGYAAVGEDTSRDNFAFWRMGGGGWSQAAAGWDNWGDWFENMGRAQSAAADAATEFALHSASPNPFNATTVLSFEMPAASLVNLKVYNTAGRLVTTLVNGWREAGNHEVTFDASDLASGVYVCRLQAGEFTAAQKMILLK